jgi:hypothetical protein
VKLFAGPETSLVVGAGWWWWVETQHTAVRKRKHHRLGGFVNENYFRVLMNIDDSPQLSYHASIGRSKNAKYLQQMSGSRRQRANSSADAILSFLAPMKLPC